MFSQPTTSLAQTLRKILSIDASKAHFVALFIGPPGSGKSVISKQLTYDYLTANQNVLYVNTERSPFQIVDRMKGFGWNVESYVGDKLMFADLYSWQVDGNNNFEDEDYGFRVCPLSEMDFMLATRKMQEHIEHSNGRVVFDSLTTLTSLIGEEKATRVAQTLNARIRASGAGLSTLTSGVHSNGFQTHMHSVYDLIFNLKIESEDKVQRFLRIEKHSEGAKPHHWIPFEIASNGILLDYDTN